MKTVQITGFTTLSAVMALTCGAVHAQQSSQPLTAQQRIEALGHRIERLRDANEVEALQHTYGFFVDKAMWSEIADLFAKDGTYEIGGRGVFVGPARVLQYLRVGMGTEHPVEGRLINHMQLEAVTTIDPDGRAAHMRMKAFVMSNGGWGDVIYENEYVKEGSVWKIAHVHAPFVMYTSQEGWARSATPNTRPDSFPPPPDRLPTVVYLTYPSPYIVPFHYPNPVTGRAFDESSVTSLRLPENPARQLNVQ